MPRTAQVFGQKFTTKRAAWMESTSTDSNTAQGSPEELAARRSRPLGSVWRAFGAGRGSIGSLIALRVRHGQAQQAEQPDSPSSTTSTVSDDGDSFLEFDQVLFESNGSGRTTEYRDSERRPYIAEGGATDDLEAEEEEDEGEDATWSWIEGSPDFYDEIKSAHAAALPGMNRGEEELALEGGARREFVRTKHGVVMWRRISEETLALVSK